MIFLISFLEIMINYFRYLALIDMEFAQFKLLQKGNLVECGKLANFLIESVLLLLTPNPWMNEKRADSYDYKNKQNVYFKLNWLMTLFLFIRVYIIARTTFYKSRYMTVRSQRLCSMYGCSSGYQYAFKCMFIDIPIYFVIG